MNGLEFICKPESILTSFEKGKIINFYITISNTSKNKIGIKLGHNLNPILENISKLQVVCPVSFSQDDQGILEPKDNKKIKFQLVSTVKKELPGSCDMPFFIGKLIVNAKKTEIPVLFPKIEISPTSSLWEKECCEFFVKLGLQVFPMSHSDRPDAVIDISGSTTIPSDKSVYLSEKSYDKILMETTRPTYSGTKLKNDVKNFQQHTTLVVKIAAVGQIIVANKFASNIAETYKKVEADNVHIITLIDKERLEYLISKFKEEQNQSKVIQVLKSNKIVNKNLIDSIFAESK